MKTALLPLLAAALASSIAAAAGLAPGALRDPWVPPDQRKAAIERPAAGESLKAQVEQKLRARFDAADTGHRGSLTRAEAQRAGLGIIANNFDRIDTARAGRVTFDDFKRYLRARGADL